MDPIDRIPTLPYCYDISTCFALGCPSLIFEVYLSLILFKGGRAVRVISSHFLAVVLLGTMEARTLHNQITGTSV
jgi:hypothetical protein